MAKIDTAAPSKSKQNTNDPRLDGVVIGILIGLNQSSSPLVAFPGNPKQTGIAARSTVPLSAEDTGREVALLFEGGDPGRPLIIGRIQHPGDTSRNAPAVTAKLDDERIVLAAKKEIILQCGKASITLTKSGKVLIRGSYLLNRSSGVNRIKGGSIQIN
jgi:hypothetical protein